MSDYSNGFVVGHTSHILPKNLPSVVLFDWDDTLFDHAKLLPHASQVFIDRYMPGKNIDDMNQEWHKDKQAFCDKYFPGQRMKPEDLTHKVWMPIMHALPREEWSLKPHVRQVISLLKNKGVKVGIVSNKPHDMLLEEVRHFGIEQDFDVVVGHRSDVPAKPAPDMVHEAMDKLGLSNACWYVGDHMDDFGATRHSNIELHVIGEKYSGRIAQLQHERRSNEPVRYFNSLENFLEFLQRVANHHERMR
ncbi:MAG: HAD family hydrolase [Rickettsiales bacterium]|jgi:phosphoglycolate phosphatase|nr:HAD family hydrolase [Rickettsiales bacterium]